MQPDERLICLLDGLEQKATIQNASPVNKHCGTALLASFRSWEREQLFAESSIRETDFDLGTKQISTELLIIEVACLYTRRANHTRRLD